MPTTYTQANRPLAVRTPLGEDVLLLEKFAGTEALSRPYAFRLDLLRHGDKPIPFADVVGKPATVEIRSAAGVTQRYFHGLVSRLSQGRRFVSPLGETFITYQADLVPRLWLLTRKVRSRIFQRLTVPDILKAVLKDEWKLDVTFQIVGPGA